MNRYLYSLVFMIILSFYGQLCIVCCFTMIIFSFLLIYLSTFTFGDSEKTFGMKLTTKKSLTEEPMQYRFRYYVKDEKTGDFKTQEEIKKGDSIQGSYSLAEPNGDLRTVTYKASPSRGFEATIDVKPSGSPIKFTSEQAPVTESIVLKKPITAAKRNFRTSILPKILKKSSALESSVKHFPGGFSMNISSKPQTNNMKTEIGMKFSMKMSNTTEYGIISTTEIINVNQEYNATENLVTDLIEEQTNHTTQVLTSDLQNSGTENLESFIEGRETTEDPVEKEINEAFNSMPKLPELVFSDNETHFKFYKDPEEISLDERITQIARQLAETSLRREYEEQKLGHFIPISLRPIESSSPTYFSKKKSFKFTKNEISNLNKMESQPLLVPTEAKVIPQYVFKQTLIPPKHPIHNRLPGILFSKTEKPQTYSTKTNLLEKSINNSFDKDIKEFNKPIQVNEYKTGSKQNPDKNVFVMTPVQVSTLPQLFSSLGHTVSPKEKNPENQTEDYSAKTTSYLQVQVTHKNDTTVRPRAQPAS